MTIRSICALGLALSVTALLAGCGPKAPVANDAPPPTYTADDEQPADTTVTEGMGAADASAYRTTVDAMVGQINGRPVYASEIFDQVGVESLTRLGAAKSRQDFRRDAISLLREHLMARVQSELVLAEVEAKLSPQEQMGLLGMLKVERENILAMFGGSVAKTEKFLHDTRGVSLDDYLMGKRHQVLVQKYLQEKLYPKISVSRRDVERYYQAHAAEYNPSPSISLRLITVADEAKADEVDAALAEGTSFEDAARKFSTTLASQGGLLSPVASTLADFKGLKWSALNEQVRLLQPGKRSPRTKVDNGYAWVELVSVEGGEGKPLSAVYPEIENHLRGVQFDQLSRKYNAELLEKGNYTPLDEMLVSLVDIAMARFARPE